MFNHALAQIRNVLSNILSEFTGLPSHRQGLKKEPLRQDTETFVNLIKGAFEVKDLLHQKGIFTEEGVVLVQRRNTNRKTTLREGENVYRACN